MSDDDDGARGARDGLEDLSRALNMDEEASTAAWRSYSSMSRSFTLEGSQLHWLACALYVSCRSSVPTVSEGSTQGNYVSLTTILRCSHMSLMEFFNKMKKWQVMAALPLVFCQSTDLLERKFTVTAVIFKKYVSIFGSVFKAPSQEKARLHRSRKQRRHPCTASEVFNFCWILFVHAKGNFPMISDDLVNSFHLLLCALDLVLANAVLSRKELLHPTFTGVPEDRSPSRCFVQQLCELSDGLVLEAKGLKHHFWKPFIRKLFTRRVLRGKEESLTGFLDPVHFGDSFLSLSRAYEEHVLSSGTLDERIFTDEDTGTCLSVLETQDTASALKVSTPLTGRTYVQETLPSSPVSSAMKSVGRLHTLLSGSSQGPSPGLSRTLRTCARDPSDVISQRLKDMLDIFSRHREDGGAEDEGMRRDVSVKFFHLAEALYFRILESIIHREQRILGHADLSCILEQDLLHRSLIACCLEIVIFSYRPPGDFPNIIHIFQLPAYHFYKVIEVLVRAEQGLFREVVKHLNQVEEQVLESLAWSSTSPLWDALHGNKIPVPSCQEVMPPQYLEQGDAVTPPHRDTHRITSNAAKGASPSPTTLLDRYSSSPTGPARRRLFVDSVDGESVDSAPSSSQPPQTSLVTALPAGQIMVTMATTSVGANNKQTVTIPVQVTGERGRIALIPVQVSLSGQGGATLTGTLTVQSASSQPASQPAPKAPGGGTLRKGSLSLFFRKVYHLASVRLRDLCLRLDVPSELRMKIWTCFEHSLVHCTELLMDRHLDQILLCAVYVMAKVTKEERSFQNIMRCYRSQPQASSSVYRSVLISGRTPHDSAGGDGPVVPSSLSCSEDERGDLIRFYNNIYIKHMKLFALRYSSNSPSAGVESPYPILRTGSPRRMLLSSKHSIYISPHKTGSAPSATTPRNNISYYICSSPPNRLQEINSMIRTGDTPTRKRSVPLEDETSPKRACPDSDSALIRRLQDVAHDRSSSH